MIYADVRMHTGHYIEERGVFHKAPVKGDIIKYPYAEVEVLRSEHVRVQDPDIPARVTVIVRDA